MIQLPVYVSRFMDVFRKKGFKIYVVGGSIRDLLLGNPPAGGPKDWDFATSATPEKILKLFPKGFYNNKFGTVGISQEEKNPSAGSGLKHIFEVTTFRTEGDYKDNRRPEKVTWAKTIEEDLARRDFTINAIAYDGKIFTDPYKGQEDIKKKLIRAVGDPDKRFQEDALRLMRAVRLSSELGFLIEDKTRDSIRNNAKLIKEISFERIRDEFLRILVSKNPAEGVLFLRSCGLLEQILPEIDACFEIPQKSPKRHHIYDVGTHLVMALKHTPSKDVITRFATLLHDIGKVKAFKKDEKSGLITFYNHEVIGAKQAGQIADRFRLSKNDKDKLVMLVREHQFTVSEIQTDKAIRRFIRGVGRDNIQDMLDLRTGDRVGSGSTATSWRLDLFKKRLIEVQKKPFSISDLKIDGKDIMKELKIKPGPQVGKILNELFEEVVEGKLKNEKKALLERMINLK